MPFEEAACAVDMAVLLPSAERESPLAESAIAAARETLTRLGAAPWLERLDSAGASTAGSVATNGVEPRRKGSPVRAET